MSEQDVNANETNIHKIKINFFIRFVFLLINTFSIVWIHWKNPIFFKGNPYNLIGILVRANFPL